MREERLKQIIEFTEKDYAEHKATYIKLDKDVTQETMEILFWQKPGTSNCYVRYCRFGLYLMVTGDLGDAIYKWGDTPTISWIADLDLGYFTGKCIASENGRGYKEWDMDWLTDEQLNHIGEMFGDEAAKVIREEDGKHASRWQQEWSCWLHDHQDDLGDEWYEMANYGECISTRAIYHLEGVKRAVAQLKAEGVLE